MKKENSTIIINMNNENKKASVETIATMLLLIILGIGMFCFTLSTVNAYKRINQEKESASEIRVANSFVMMKIRQNDAVGCLNVLKEPTTNKNALVIYENIKGVSYATWIYSYKGILWEALVLREEMPTLDVSQAIAKIDEFDILYDSKEKGFFIRYGITGQKHINTFIKTRTQLGEEL